MALFDLFETFLFLNILLYRQKNTMHICIFFLDFNVK